MISITETGWYSASTIDPYNCAVADSIHVTVSGCLLDAPNVFSPNGDGINDGFSLHAYGVENPMLYIYDRWGLKMAEVIPPAESWDGTVTLTGQPAPDGVYYWVVNWRGSTGVPQSASGYVHLMR